MINKLKNNKFLASTFILLIGGSFTKIIGFILRIVITRQIGTEGVGLYSMLQPTFSLLSVIAVFSYPTAISKLISMKNRNSKSLILSIIPISLIINGILILIVVLFAPILSNNLLKEPRLYFPIICIALTMPFVGLSSIVKGYFWGKQRMAPYIVSNVVEQITRLIFIAIFIPGLVKESIVAAICFIFLVNIAGEVVSILIMLKKIPKNELHKSDFKIERNEVKDVMGISIPTTSSKIIGSISYFLEPIIITNVFLYLGYSSQYIINEYGVFNGYAIGLLLMPSFFTQSMSYALIPELSKYYSQKEYETCKRRIKQIVYSSFSIGLIFTIIIFIFPSELLSLLYKTNLGVDYIRFLAPFTLLYFIENPLINALQALGEAKKCMKITIIGSVVKVLTITVFSFLKIGMYSVMLSTIVTIIVNTYLYYYNLKKVLN